jgi:Fanconi anemia group M protein
MYSSPAFRQLVSFVQENMSRYNHPKLLKMDEIVQEHFEQHSDTRVMVFVEFRDSVDEIVELLSGRNSRIRPAKFIGQSGGSKKSPTKGKSKKGMSQKEQTEALERFRKGVNNVLVATCIGEEGLDIGEVDLIVCVDALQSPTRLVQRMGRTGRAREGRCVILMVEGCEEKHHKKAESQKASIFKAIHTRRDTAFVLHPHNPRLVSALSSR